MTLQEIAKDILRLLQKSNLVDDSRLSERHIRYKIHQYRAEGIKETYRQTGKIEPIWLQTLTTPVTTQVAGVTTTVNKPHSIFTKTNSADDLTLQGCDCPFGRFKLPPIVSLPPVFNGPNDHGIFRVSMASRQEKYFPISIDRIFELVPGSSRARNNYYFRMGDILYITPLREKISLILILDNPLDAGISATDEYPMSFTLAEFVVMKILTQDFNIEAKVAADLRNDAADALVALQQQSQS